MAPWLAGTATLGTAAFWPLPYYATGGTADVVVALALLGAVAEIERGFTLERTDALWRAGLFVALGAMAKNEGLALMVVALAAVAWAVRRDTGRLRRIIPLTVPLLAAAPWLVFRFAHGLSTDTLCRPIHGRHARPPSPPCLRASGSS